MTTEARRVGRVALLYVGVVIGAAVSGAAADPPGNGCNIAGSELCDLGAGNIIPTPEPLYLPPCWVGCYVAKNALPGWSLAGGMQVDPRVAWGLPDLPPFSTDVRSGTSPLVPADAGHAFGAVPFAVRPRLFGAIDAVTGSRALENVDLELRFGGAVFRHVRTESDSWSRLHPCAYTGAFLESLNDERSMFDWNGRRWMMGEAPLFLIDANPHWNMGEPRKCYFIPDAHHSIPFVWDSNNQKYTAPPWIDASLSYSPDGVLSAEGEWEYLPRYFYVWLNRRSVKYTIAVHGAVNQGGHVEPSDVPAESHAPSSVPECEATDETGIDSGVPYLGFVTRIEDRNGHKVVIEYCGESAGACDYDLGNGVSCGTTCRNCNERGQISRVLLFRPDSETGEDRLEWTLLYTFRGFASYCERSGACDTEPECRYQDDGFNNHSEANRPHFLHSIHVYRNFGVGTEGVGAGIGCLTISGREFCVIDPAAFDTATVLDAYDKIDHPVIPPGWQYAMRYTYDEYQYPTTYTEWETCPTVCETKNGAANFTSPTAGRLRGGNLLKASLIQRVGGSEAELVNEWQYHLSDVGGPLAAPDLAVIGLSELESIRKRELAHCGGAGGDCSKYEDTANFVLGLPEWAILHPDGVEGDPQDPPRLSKYFALDTKNALVHVSSEWLENLAEFIEADPLRTNLLGARRVRTPGGRYWVYHFNEYPVPETECSPPGCGAGCEFWNYQGGFTENSIRQESVHYPYRYATVAGVHCGDSANYYRRLMDGPAGGERRFHIAMVDSLACDTDACESTYQPGTPDGLRELKSRRVIEMNAAGLVLKDRTWGFADGVAELESSSGAVDQRRYDCSGRILEHRTSGWSAAESAGTGATEGLIYLYDYEDECGWATNPAGITVCMCSGIGGGAPVEASQRVRPGELVWAGIKRGTDGASQSLREFERHSDRPEFVARSTVFLTPAGAAGATATTDYVYEFDATQPVAMSDRRLLGREIRRPATPLHAGGPAMVAVDRTRYDRTGNTILQAYGSVVDPDSSSPDDELFVDCSTYDGLGRPDVTIIDAEDADPPGDRPPGFARSAGADALRYVTDMDYDAWYGLSHVVHPNGRHKYIVHKPTGDDATSRDIWVYDDVIPDTGEDPHFQALSPVQIAQMRNGRLGASLTVALTDTDGVPSGDEPYTIISEFRPTYDESGRVIEVASSDGANGSGGIELTASVGYNPFGQVDREQGPAGTIQRHVFDQRGRLRKIYRGTNDEHDFWGTAPPRGSDEGEYDPCALYPDNMVLLEARNYGSGATDSGKVIEVRHYREKPVNQYQEAWPWPEECENPPAEFEPSNEASLGWREQLYYDWRMRQVVRRIVGEDGLPITHDVAWLDHRDNTMFSATYAEALPEGLLGAIQSASHLSGGAAMAQALLASEPRPLTFTETLINARGESAETRQYMPAADAGGQYQYTSTCTFYDHRGKVSERVVSGGVTTRYTYDAKGREVVSATFGAGAEQARSETSYDTNDRAIRTRRWERVPNRAGDALDASNAVRTDVYSWFDVAGRIVATMRFGTNGAGWEAGTPLPPDYGQVANPAQYVADRLVGCGGSECDAGALCSCYGYDAAGRQNAVFHPDGTVTRTEFDGLGRIQLTIENAEAETGSLRHVTARAYDALGRLERIAAVLPGHTEGSIVSWNQVNWEGGPAGTLQVTQLRYGADVVDGGSTGPGGGNVISGNHDWVSEVWFPSAADGLADPYDSLRFQYYADGSLASRVDQRGVRLSHVYDELGRRTFTDVDDSAWYTGTPPASVPPFRVDGIGVEYFPSGAPRRVTAESDGSLVAASDFVYDNFHNLLRETQTHYGGGGAAIPTVDYDWDTPAENGLGINRLVALSYPERVGSAVHTTVNHEYGESLTSTASTMGWLTGVNVSNLGAVAEYRYDGASRRVSADLGNGLRQTLESSTGLGGLDRFGRVVDLHFCLGGCTSGATVHRSEYAYDRNDDVVAHRLTQVDWDHESRANVRSWRYSYDELNRLISADMGVLSLDMGSIVVGGSNPQPTRSNWYLDNLGNWSAGDPDGADGLIGPSYVRWTDHDGDNIRDIGEEYGVHHRTSSNNEFDQIVELTEAAGAFAYPAVFDPVGNLVSDGRFIYQYDGLNRLVQVNLVGSASLDADGRITFGQLGNLVLRYVYDGLGRIIRKEQPEGAGFTQLRRTDYYYDGVRRIQEVVRRPIAVPEPEPCYELPPMTKDPRSPGWVEAGGDTIGPDVPPCDPEFSEGGTSGPTYETWTEREYVYGPDHVDHFILQIDRDGSAVYMLQDESANVVALVDAAGQVLRQDVYHPYGELAATDFFDLAHAPNSAGWKGLFFDKFTTMAADSPLTPGAAGIYQNRNRSYSPSLGRFLQRDPNATAAPLLEAALSNGESFALSLGSFDLNTLYGDGMNLYAFAGSNPLLSRDPMGLSADDLLIARDWDAIYDSFTGNGRAYLGAQGAATWGSFWGQNIAVSPQMATHMAAVSEGWSEVADQYAEEFISMPFQLLGARFPLLGLIFAFAQPERHAEDIGELFEAWLNQGKEEVRVYVAFEKGRAVATYVGITNKIERRGTEWKGTYDKLDAITVPLTRNQARAVEQVVIEANPRFYNINNSVRPAHRFYARAAEWAKAFVKRNGIKIKF